MPLHPIMPLQSTQCEKDMQSDKDTHGCGLPRIMQADSVVLCGIDFPEIATDGKLRVIVALKRVWHDAPRDIALILRDVLPSGDRRAAVIQRSIGDEAETIGIEVPMGEDGVHQITLQIAKNINGELIELFRIEKPNFNVRNPPAPNLGESHGLCLRGIDLPDHVNSGALRAIVAVERVSTETPKNLCLVVRDTLPCGQVRSAVVRKNTEETHFTIGVEVPMGEAGHHTIELFVTQEQDGELEVIFTIPAVLVFVSNPCMPRIQEHGSVVLCGIDVNGARWPSLIPDVVTGTLRAIVAIARTWEDAPERFALLVRCVDSEGNAKVAVARKVIKTLTPETIGLEAPLCQKGSYVVEVTVAVDRLGIGEYETIFSLPKVPVEVDGACKEQSFTAASNEVSTEIVTVPLKVSYVDLGKVNVIRRLSLQITSEKAGSVFAFLLSSVMSAFESELGGCSTARLTYKDQDGDDVVVSSNDEVWLALEHLCPKTSVLRMTLSRG